MSLSCSEWEWYPSEVSEIILLDENTVRTYFEKYILGGLTALLKTSYRGSCKKITDDQIMQRYYELDNNIHLTTKSVCRFTLLEFDVEYSERGMASLLKNIGYVYKKPDLKPGEPDEELQEYFPEEKLKNMIIPSKAVSINLKRVP